MKRLSKQVIDALVERQGSPAVTIYIPMHLSTASQHLSENQIRFKNLLHSAADIVFHKGYGSMVSDQLRETVEQFRNDSSFWEQQTASLLICADAQGIEMIQLPIDTEEYVAVDEKFHLAPALGLLSDAKDFYLLLLAQHAPKLYRGTNYSLEATNISLPSSVRDALHLDETRQKSENQATATGPSGSGGGSWFNGRGGTANTDATDRLRFFRLIDTQLALKGDTSLPLILSGIDSEIAEFRSLSKFPQLLQTPISGNHATTPVAALFRTAHEIIDAELVEPMHTAALEEFSRLSGTNPRRVAKNEGKVTEAALQGRVNTLLATMYRRTSDTVRDSFDEVLRITFPDTFAASKRLNEVAAKVWQMSGEVINVLPNQIPNHQLMVARLRY